MSGPWALRVPMARAGACVRLRLLPGLEVLQDGDHLWVRGMASDPTLVDRLLGVPDGERYEVLPDGRRRRAGHRVPGSAIPDGDWMGIAEWFPIAPPRAALPAEAPERASLTLQAGGEPWPENVLRTTLERWRKFALAAPEFRVKPLRFAVSPHGETLIWGRPVPPLRGSRYVERGGIAIPLGRRWSPPVGGSVLTRLLKLETGELIIFDSDDAYERIRPEDFVAASRSAVRATWRRATGA